MFGISIHNHEAISYMTLGYALEVVNVHEYCTVTTCPMKRQAVALINQTARSAGVRP